MRNGPPYSAILIATLAIFLTGCSRNPVAPITDTSSGPGAGTTAIAVVPDDPPPADGGTPGFRTVTLAAAEEGVVTVGRFTLWVRKNSLKMPATITLNVADAEATECEITVSPEEANDFSQSVFLYANMSDVVDFDYDNGTFLVWNGNWQWSTETTTHVKEQNVFGHFKSLSKVRVSDGSDTSNNKMGS